MTLPELLTVEEVRDALRLKNLESTRRWLRRTACPFVRVGNRKLIMRETFLAHLRALQRAKPRVDQIAKSV